MKTKRTEKMTVKLNYSFFHRDMEKGQSFKDQDKSATTIKSANAAKLKGGSKCC